MNLFVWFREKKRQRILLENPIPDKTWGEIQKNFPVIRKLNPIEKRRCRDLASQFAGEKTFYPRGVRWSQEKAWTLSALAVLPLLNLGLEPLRKTQSIYILPHFYKSPRIRQEGVLETSDWEELSGEVTEFGALVFAWEDVKASGQGEGFNVVIHEIAHLLDEGNGAFDGCPKLRSQAQYDEWDRVMSQAYQELQGSKTRKGVIDTYAAESPQEFFAVVMEEYFDRPRHLQRTWPQVVRVLEGWMS